MKSYDFYRDSHGNARCHVTVAGDDVAAALTYSLRHEVRHSPTGINFGYGGSGPADAALSVLADCVGPPLAERFYQDFKREFIAPLPQCGGTITEKAILEWLADDKLKGCPNAENK